MSFQTKNPISFEKLLLRSPECQETVSARALGDFGVPGITKCPGATGFLTFGGRQKRSAASLKKILAKPGSVGFGVENVAPNSSNSCLELKGAKIMRLKVGASKWAENVGRQALLRFWGGRTSQAPPPPPDLSREPPSPEPPPPTRSREGGRGGTSIQSS